MAEVGEVISCAPTSSGGIRESTFDSVKSAFEMAQRIFLQQGAKNLERAESHAPIALDGNRVASEDP